MPKRTSLTMTAPSVLASNPRQAFIAITGILLLGAFLRLSALHLDFPHWVSTSAEPSLNPGLKALNAWNMAQNGTPRSVPFDLYTHHSYLSPVPFLFWWGGFSVAPSPMTAAFVNGLLGIFNVFIIFVIARTCLSIEASIVAAALSTVCFPLLVYDRVSLYESFINTAVLLSVLACVVGKTSRLLAVVVMAVSVLFGLLTKELYLLSLPGVFVFLLWQSAEGRWRSLSVFGGLGLGYLVYFARWSFPPLDALKRLARPAEMIAEVHERAVPFQLAEEFQRPGVIPHDLSEFAMGVLRVSYFPDRSLFAMMPIVFAVGMLGLPFLAKKFCRRERTDDETLLQFSMVWLFVGLAVLSPWEYRPNRYYVWILPSCIFLFSFCWQRWQETTQALMSNEWKARLASGFSVWFMSFTLLGATFRRVEISSSLALVIGGLLGVGVAVLPFLLRPSQRDLLLSVLARHTLRNTLFFFALASGLGQWAWSFVLSPQTTSGDIADYVESLPVGLVAGELAPNVVIGKERAGVRAIASQNQDNLIVLYKEVWPTYLVSYPDAPLIQYTEELQAAGVLTIEELRSWNATLAYDKIRTVSVFGVKRVEGEAPEVPTAPTTQSTPDTSTPASPDNTHSQN